MGSPPPVGVRRLRAADECAPLPVYQGVSYCDAVRQAGEGLALRILPGSVQVCRWMPVVLGLKQPQGRFEEGLTPRLPYPVAGLLVAPLDRFPGEPEIVIVRAPAEVLQGMIAAVGRERLWDGHGAHHDRSALPLLAAGQDPVGQGYAARRALTSAVNRLLAALAPSDRWQALTRWLFRSGAVTAGFEALISRALADMSVCRNSTAIPLLTGRANVSFFCTGGITWGRNQPGHLTSGWPWSDFQQACRESGALPPARNREAGDG